MCKRENIEYAIKVLTKRAIEKGFIKTKSEVKIEYLKNGNAWVFIPRRHYQGTMVCTIMKNNRGHYESVIGKH